jgi:RNA polymerase sigma-70 factor (ECF subfamily)
MATSPALARLVLLRGGADDGNRVDKGVSDAELALALMRGEKAAARVAFVRFVPMARRSLRRLLGPGLDEEDLCQEVFLRFFRRIHDLRDPAAVRGFLLAVCLRVGRQELRRRWLRRWLRLTDSGSLPEASDEAASKSSDDPASDARDAVNRYYRILDTVGGQGRSLFAARYIEGSELVEVARSHGLSVSTTQRRLSRVAKRVDAMVRRDPLLSELADLARDRL